ncbi:hypothetical protein A8L34_23680 [Bacillus sp. FJAT-27264]|nr:hypothetical protein A8L34_23680 [Bacillus sp. FJAT-27264]
MFITIGYVAFSLFTSGIFIFRTIKQKFTKYHTEHVGLLVSYILVGITLKAPIEIKAGCTLLLLLTFIYGTIKS